MSLSRYYFGLLLGIVILFTSQGWAIDRCSKYLPLVKRHSFYIGGLNAPYYYFMAQIEVESSCREGVIASDGGQGLFQIMPATAEELNNRYPYLRQILYNPLSPEWNIRAGILYDYSCYKATICKGWYYAFRAYNGGAGNLNKEIKYANSCEWTEIEENCRRSQSFCEINIAYPYKIFERSKRWKVMN